MTTPPTRTTWADARLRTAILTGELAPGTRLRAEHLAETLGVSPTPLREAFQRLAGEGLVVIEPQRGARVAPIDARDAAELYDIRLALEPDAFAASIERSDARHRDDVARAHRHLSEPTSDVATVLVAHRAFHDSLLARCPNGRLLTLIGQLHDQSERFLLAGAFVGSEHSPTADHAALARAVANNDAPLARTTLREHLAGVRDAIVASTR